MTGLCYSMIICWCWLLYCCWELPPRLNHQHTHTKSWFLLLYWPSKKDLFPLKITRVPFSFSSCSNVYFITVNHWFGFRLKDSKVQGYQIPTCCLSRHCTYNIFSDHIVYNQNKAKIASSVTKATNYNTPHNFRHCSGVTDCRLNGERTVKGDLPSERKLCMYASLQTRQGVRFIIVAIRFPIS